MLRPQRAQSRSRGRGGGRGSRRGGGQAGRARGRARGPLPQRDAATSATTLANTIRMYNRQRPPRVKLSERSRALILTLLRRLYDERKHRNRGSSGGSNCAVGGGAEGASEAEVIEGETEAQREDRQRRGRYEQVKAEQRALRRGERLLRRLTRADRREDRHNSSETTGGVGHRSEGGEGGGGGSSASEQWSVVNADEAAVHLGVVCGADGSKVRLTIARGGTAKDKKDRKDKKDKKYRGDSSGGDRPRVGERKTIVVKRGGRDTDRLKSLLKTAKDKLGMKSTKGKAAYLWVSARESASAAAGKKKKNKKGKNDDDVANGYVLAPLEDTSGLRDDDTVLIFSGNPVPEDDEASDGNGDAAAKTSKSECATNDAEEDEDDEEDELAEQESATAALRRLRDAHRRKRQASSGSRHQDHGVDHGGRDHGHANELVSPLPPARRDAEWSKIQETRRALPVFRHRDAILKAVEGVGAAIDSSGAELSGHRDPDMKQIQVHASTVVVLSGATGCGKTTQIPQYLLEHADQQYSAAVIATKATATATATVTATATSVAATSPPAPRSPEAAAVRTRMATAGDGGGGGATDISAVASETEALLADPQINIICTQPRRISAIAVAERVAAERGERVGETVGYTVRLESRRSARTRLLFCTTGVLLRRMHEDPTLEGVTHVLVDEVHERDVLADFLLIILRNVLWQRHRHQHELQGSESGGSAPAHVRTAPLRLVLMSATVDADLFVKYFTPPQEHQLLPGYGPPSLPPPRIDVPGRLFPVTEHYLEDIVESIGYKPSREYLRAHVSEVRDGRRAGADGDAEAAFVWGEDDRDGNDGDMDNGSVDDDDVADDGVDVDDGDVDAGEDDHEPGVDTAQYVDSLAKGPDAAPQSRRSPLSPAALKIMRTLDGQRAGEQRADGEPNEELIEALILYICRNSDSGDGEHKADDANAILVFLPGSNEINRLQRRLERSGSFPSDRFWIVPLHGSLPASKQRQAFKLPPPGVQKVVLATNIAETSVTIPDVTHVIDTGRVKEMRYDAGRQMGVLEQVYISRAAATQRRGRAGRVRAGDCWRLYSRRLFTREMAAFATPEILRVPLEELVLQVLLMEMGSPEQFLAMALQPPRPSAVRHALRQLHELGALALASPAHSNSAGSCTAVTAAGAAGPAVASKKTIQQPQLSMQQQLEQTSSVAVELTPLGFHLARMPIDVRLGKMLIFAAVFSRWGVLEPMLTIAAALSHKSPFLSPAGGSARFAAAMAKRSFAGDGTDSTIICSDLLAVVHAFDGWHACANGQQPPRGSLASGTQRVALDEDSDDDSELRQALSKRQARGISFRGHHEQDVAGRHGRAPGRSGGSGDAALQELARMREARTKRLARQRASYRNKYDFCDRNALSSATMQMMASIREQLRSALRSAGFASGSHSSNGGGGGIGASGGSERGRVELLKCLLCACLAPARVVRIVRPGRGARGGGLKLLGAAEQVWVHPSSVSSNYDDLRNSREGDWIVYHEKVETSRVFLRDTTVVGTFPLLLFGGPICVDHNAGQIEVGGWMRFKAPPEVGVMFKEVQNELDKVLLAKAADPSLDVASGAGAAGALDVVVQLVGAEEWHEQEPEDVDVESI